MTYFDPGAGSLLIQVAAAFLIGWVSTIGRVKAFLKRVFFGKVDKE